MSKNLKACISELQHVTKLKGKARRDALNKLSTNPCIFLALKEIARNTRNGNIKANKKILRYIKFIKRLDTPKLKKSQKVKLVKQSGGFLGAIIPAVISAIAALASR